MIPLATTLLLFLFTVIVGIAAMEASRFRFGVVRDWLLAPIVGLAVIMSCVMVVSQAGLPVHGFALPLTAALLIASSAIVWWRRPMLPVQYLWPFGTVLAFALVYIGWQAIPYGFNWAGYGNADALAYCHSASRIIDHGFFDTPKLVDLLGRDYTQASWFQFGPGMYRCGFDLFLAWAASLTGLNPFAIYMPVMLYLGMAQISGLAALVLSRPRLWRLALLSAALLAMSPLFGFTVVAQVGPQVGGLALMLGLCALTLRGGSGGWRPAVPQGIMIGVVGTALAVFYPEALPFFGLSYGGFHITLALVRRQDWGFQLRVATTATAAAVILARTNLLRGYFSMVFAIQFSKATEAGASTEYTGFEIFKMPHGAAVLLGLSDGHRLAGPLWLSLLITLAFVLLIVLLYTVTRDAMRLESYAFVAIALAAATALVFRSPNSFGVFKMALYLQPAVMAAAAAATRRLPRPGVVSIAGAYLVITFVPHYWAVTSTTGALPGFSSVGMNLPKMIGGAGLETDTPTSVPMSLLQLYLKGTHQISLNDRGGVRSQANWVRRFAEPLLGKYNPYPQQVAESEVLESQLIQIYRRETCLGFSILPDPDRNHGQVQLATVSTAAAAYFNGMGYERGYQYFSYPDAASVKNFLAFVNSDKGMDAYSFSNEPSFYPLEQDLFQPSRKFYGIGRYLLFEVINPSDVLRVRVSLSRTLVGDGRCLLPRSALVLGEPGAPLPFVGAGAANIFSAPVGTASLNGRHYIAIDFGDALISPPNRKQGLMRLFNAQIPLDVRRLVAYGRDISAITEEEYVRMERPRMVSKWPDDLFRGKGAEFSGFYEDGWVSEHAMMKFGPSRVGEHLVIRGVVPGIGALSKGNLLRVSLDGKLTATEPLRPGAFEVSIPILADLRATTVNLDFAAGINLPGKDGRPAAAQIQSIGVR